tara:strand:+ start:300 stop:1067 length:768 start_codon:yes stop_codon:yes gene_type:complete
MKKICIIPARMGSSRFPGKPLAKIKGKTMIERVYKRSSYSQNLDYIIVATPDQSIIKVVEDFGGKAIITSNKHQRASDRCAEALRKIETEVNKKFDIVVMVQGDEPLVHPEMINESIEELISNPSINVVNLLGKIDKQSQLDDQNTIKVVVDKYNNALYFSRLGIPFKNNLMRDEVGKQVCVIPFRRHFLIEYLKMEETKLEKLESIDMLRILQNGYKVRMKRTEYKSHPVDIKSDILIVEEMLQHDSFYKKHGY